MNVDCQWVEKNLEALYCDRLSEAESLRAKTHIDTCESCRRESQALNAIDPLIKNHFRRELDIARRPRVVNRGRVLGLSGAAAAVLVLLLVVFMRAPQTGPVALPPPASPVTAPEVASAPSPAPIKNDQTEQVPGRAKPDAVAATAPANQTARPAAGVSANAPDFLVADPAGYSHGLLEYRGRRVLIAVWKPGETDTIEHIERLYKAHATNPKIRLLGVSNERDPKPANTTFPVLYNQGSKLLGAQPGQFVLLDESGNIELRGSLVKDFENLTKALRGK